MSNFADFSIGLYEKALPTALSWQERFEQAGRAGYDFVEFSVDDSDARLAKLEWSDAERSEFRIQAKASGLFVPTMALSGNHRFPIGSEDEAVRTHAMEILDKAIGLASDLGIRLIQVAGYDELEDRPGTERTAARYAENLDKSLRIAQKRGVMLAIENMGVPFMDSIRKVMNYVEMFNTPYLQVYADIGNSYAMGQDVEADIESARGHIAAMHIKDTKPGIVRNIPFGEGTVDFPKCFRKIENIGYTGLFVLEMWAGERADTFDEIKSSLEFVKNHMKTVWSD
ncbi:MAG: L-ribulose-5-phosphate 3-epimerase [Spirochaetales bacterium]|uniref:L-ribulose-5-phosphate 3-epimerase n=1 Tax=Candidatus Thalassospirochaeta sargassi TaxID=3119039 RepID=A0AAJ1MNC1_9SPIO|nr:L-ribulose-5-phosphate 3-epimerase [Spirochaetales bacterium]